MKDKSVVGLWWLSLGLSGVVVAVVAALLGEVIAAAKSIDRHADAIWTVGKQIAGNTVSIWMLEKTNEELGRIAQAGRAIEQTVGSMDEKLKALATTDGKKG